MDEDKEITIDEFEAELLQDFRAWKAAWKANAVLRPSDYPPTLSSADWWEQYLTSISL